MNISWNGFRDVRTKVDRMGWSLGIRIRYNLTQDDLVRKLNVRRETIVFLEKNKYNPSLKLAYEIEKFLNCLSGKFLFLIYESRYMTSLMDDRNIAFRIIEEKDNREMAELIRTVFREFRIDRPGTVYFDPTTDDLYNLFRTPGSEYWIAEENGVIIGGCGVYPTPGLPEGCAELVKLYLSASQRGKGIGWKLMEMTFKSAEKFGYKQLYLESLPELSKAISLYERTGFKRIPGPLGNSGHFGCNIWMIKELKS